MADDKIYVSITGLRLNKPWHLFRFARHAIGAMRQARRAEGNLLVKARTIDGVRHTLTAWRSESAMRAFLYRGAHRKAIRAFGTFATGQTCGFEMEAIPSWSEAVALWRQHGRAYQAPQAAE